MWRDPFLGVQAHNPRFCNSNMYKNTYFPSTSAEAGSASVRVGAGCNHSTRDAKVNSAARRCPSYHDKDTDATHACEWIFNTRSQEP